MNKAHQFKTSAEAAQIMSALVAAGKIYAWDSIVCFGRVTARVHSGKGWSKLTEADFAALVAA
jgi:hypothetical protein